jgi:cytochrome c
MAPMHRNASRLAGLGAVVALASAGSSAPGAGSATTGRAGDAGIERGRALLAQYQCGSCHTIPGVAASRGTAAQPLAGWGGRSYIAGRLPNRPDVLARWIAAPQALVPGTAMPDMGVSAPDAAAMAAYLMALE